MSASLQSALIVAKIIQKLFILAFSSHQNHPNFQGVRMMNKNGTFLHSKSLYRKQFNSKTALDQYFLAPNTQIWEYFQLIIFKLFLAIFPNNLKIACFFCCRNDTLSKHTVRSQNQTIQIKKQTLGIHSYFLIFYCRVYTILGTIAQLNNIF